ncbi:hypothetical protein [Jeotgalibacillus campisalis]|uniref:Group-specific protein n=1 Tax=Jeotgalibacillus campisalis TaxID=220754 RepID=A0A0C2VGL5_9BACL|nr:hypothetical protein [Jeotgalibacillus campisalis]KIL47997.1 hypothetical protein KR50_21640 [Jeotgalibacillus campisalis]
MFDPTAFDNLKTVLEGTIYDRDLDGTISILNRADVIDIATLNRSYSVIFQSAPKEIEAEMSLKADLKKLAVELLPSESGEQNKFAGAVISITYRKKGTAWDAQELEIFNKQWGQERCWELRTISSNRHEPICEMTIQFDRTITEDMLRDVEEMVYYTIETADLLGSRKKQ